MILIWAIIAIFSGIVGLIWSLLTHDNYTGPVILILYGIAILISFIIETRKHKHDEIKREN
jgi:ABC-type Mn2+/Zn2+ transport system permease subunit